MLRWHFAGLVFCVAWMAGCGEEGQAPAPPAPGPAPVMDVGAPDTGAAADVEPDMGAPTEDAPEPDPEPPGEDVGPMMSRPAELPLNEIEVFGRLARPDAAISSMAWFGDQLVLLPRFPIRFVQGGDRGVIFVLRQDQLLGALEQQRQDPIITSEVAFEAPGLEAAVPGYEGFEAIAFRNFEVFLTVKAIVDGVTKAYLFKGELSGDLRTLSVDVAGKVALPDPPPGLPVGYEALAISEGRAIALPGINGVDFVRAPSAPVLSAADLSAQDPVPMAPLGLRLADVTTVDLDGTFWAINRRGSDEDELEPSPDPLIQRYGEVGSHLETDAVERLVQLRLGEQGVEIVERPPILVSLGDRNRRWEAVVRLGSEGFLLMTSSPTVVLGFLGTL